jgi:RHS repeat-associated protein
MMPGLQARWRMARWAIGIILLTIGSPVANATYVMGSLRRGTGVGLRFHVNGAQYIDERVATYTEPSALREASTLGRSGPARQAGCHGFTAQPGSHAECQQTPGTPTRFRREGVAPYGVPAAPRGDRPDPNTPVCHGSVSRAVAAAPRGGLDTARDASAIPADPRGTGGFTYYLGTQNFSIAGTGNADGTVIERLDYSSTGDFAGGGPGATSFYHDADGDGDLDLRDFANLQVCFDPSGTVTTQACLDVHDFDTADASDGDIDLDDYHRFAACFRGLFVTPDQDCGLPVRRSTPPPSGTFTLHGRPIDLLADGHTLLDFRARSYDPNLGRWLQRDPLPYNDGTNLYESFRGNAPRFSDPFGEGILTWLYAGRYDASDWEFIKRGGPFVAAYGFVEGGANAANNVAIGTWKGVREITFTAVDAVVAPVDVASTLIFNEPLGRPLSQLGQAATNPDSLGQLIATTGSRNVLNAVSLGAFNVVEGTVIYVQTGDAETFSQNVGGQGFLILATAGAVRASTSAGIPRPRAVAGGELAETQLAQIVRLVEQETAQAYAAVRAGRPRAPGTGRLTLPKLVRLEQNVGAGRLGEAGARQFILRQGETIIETQFQEGAVLRGIDFASFVRGPQGPQLFLNEVSSTAGLRSPGTFTALGLGRGGPSIFRQNLRQVGASIRAQVADRSLRAELLRELQTAPVRLVGPRGFNVTDVAAVRIHDLTGHPVGVLIVP